MNPIGYSVGLVVDRGVRRCVSVVDELGLETRERERKRETGEEIQMGLVEGMRDEPGDVLK